MTTSTVVFRVSSGPKIGLGHLHRCLSLASALALEGIAAHFVIVRDSEARVWIEERGHTVAEISETSTEKRDLAVTLKELDILQAKVVVVDCRTAGTGYLRELRRAGCYVVSIDDLGEIIFPSHVIINGNVYAHKLSYESDSEGAVFLLGPKYAILDHEFWHISKNEIREDVANVCVILGGSDVRNLTGRLLGLLDNLPGKFSVTVVVGPYCEIAEEVKRAAQRCSKLMRVVHAPRSLKAILVDTDLAISGGGQALNMLARIGCPTVALAVAPDQRENVEAIAEAGAVRGIRLGSNENLDEIRDAVVSLIGDSDARRLMNKAGEGLIDGQGTLRISAVIRGCMGTLEGNCTQRY